MIDNDIRVDIQQVDEETAIINLTGDLTNFADQPIYDAYNYVTDCGIRKVIFHFAEDNMIFTPGLAILIDIIMQAHKRKQDLLMAVPNAYFQRIFALVGIGQHVKIFNSLEEARQQAL